MFCAAPRRPFKWTRTRNILLFWRPRAAYYPHATRDGLLLYSMLAAVLAAAVTHRRRTRKARP